MVVVVDEGWELFLDRIVDDDGYYRYRYGKSGPNLYKSLKYRTI